MPVYNGIKTVGKAIESLLGQTHGDFVLFISDNASRDGTSELLRSYAARDRRIRLVRQERNRGASWNFLFVLRQATCPYFMWAASDDYWDADFVRENLLQLRTDPRVVLSVSQAFFIAKDGSLVPVTDTFALNGIPARNICDYVDAPQTNSRFYGIYRRAVIAHACTRAFGHYLASDWAVMVETLRHGHHAEVPRPLLYRHAGGASGNALRLLALFRKDPLDFFFPMARFTFATLRVGTGNRSLRLHLLLLRHNLKYALLWFLPLINLIPTAVRQRMKVLLRMHR